MEKYRLRYAIKTALHWLLKLRIKVALLFQPFHSGRIFDVVPFRGVLVVRSEGGLYVVSSRDDGSPDEYTIQIINNNRYEE